MQRGSGSPGGLPGRQRMGRQAEGTPPDAASGEAKPWGGFQGIRSDSLEDLRRYARNMDEALSAVRTQIAEMEKAEKGGKDAL